MGLDSSAEKSSSKLLRFHTKSGKKYSPKLTYFSVMLKGDIRKFTNLVFGNQSSKESRAEAFRASKFCKIEYIADIINFCSSEEWNVKNTQA